ncbi:MAG: hypothetical protein AB7H97_19620 [Pseudobdellovibrionaceae bacterium]
MKIFGVNAIGLLSPFIFVSVAQAYPPFMVGAREELSLKIDSSTVSCVKANTEGYPKDLEVLQVILPKSPQGSRFVHMVATQSAFQALHTGPCPITVQNLINDAAQTGGIIKATSELQASIGGLSYFQPDGKAVVVLTERVYVPFSANLGVISYHKANVVEDDARVKPRDPRYPTYHVPAPSLATVLLNSETLKCRVRNTGGYRFRVTSLTVPGVPAFARLQHQVFTEQIEVEESISEQEACAPIETLKNAGSQIGTFKVTAHPANRQQDTLQIWETVELNVLSLKVISQRIEEVPLSDFRIQ